MAKTVPATKLMAVIDKAVQGSGPSKVTVGDKVVTRKGYWCTIEPGRKAWIPVVEADALGRGLYSRFKSSSHPQTCVELVIKPVRGRGATTVKNHNDLQKWLQANLPNGQDETPDDGWTWSLRVRI